MLNLYVSETLPPDVSLVASADAPVPTILPEMLFGDAPSVTIKIVDVAGGISSTSGVGILNVAIGVAGSTPVSSNTFITSGDAWVGKLALNTSALNTLMGSMAALNARLQIQLLDVNGQPQTICFAPIKILQSVIPATLFTGNTWLILGDDGLIYQLTAIVINGVPTISPQLYNNQNVTAPSSVTITGNDSVSYTYVVQVVSGIPTLVNQ